MTPTDRWQSHHRVQMAESMFSARSQGTVLAVDFEFETADVRWDGQGDDYDVVAMSALVAADTVCNCPVHGRSS